MGFFLSKCVFVYFVTKLGLYHACNGKQYDHDNLSLYMC